MSQVETPGLARVFRRLWPQIRREKKMLWLSSAALIGEVLMRVIEPWPIKFVIDRVLGGSGRHSAHRELLAMSDPLTLVGLAALATVVFGGVRALASYGSTVGLALVGNRVLTEVRADLYRHLQALSLSFHNKARNGELMVRVMGDVGMLRDVTVSAMLPFATNLLMVAGMVAVMFWLDWRLALLAIATLPLFWIRTAQLTRRLHDASRDQRRREGAMAATAAESISAIKVVQALSLEGVFARAFTDENDKSLEQGARATRLEAGLERTVDVLIAISSALVLWYGARLVLRGALTAGGLVVFLTYLKNAFKPVKDFAKYTGRLAKASAAGERILDLFDRVPDLRNLDGAVAAPAFVGAVEFRKIRFAYEPGHAVLDDLNLAIEPGQRVALVGDSGAGKSTIASLLLRLYDPQEGEVRIDGQDIRCFTLESLRPQISVVLQDTLLFAATVRENIALGMPKATPDQIEEAARLASADEFIRALPEGYDTILGERGVTISSGQRQRLGIARAAVRSSPILLLDEPTTGLDEENRTAVAAALMRLARGRTTLLITHDLALGASADRVIFLQAGQIAERGSHDELMRAGGRYARLFKLQSGGRQQHRTEEAVSALIA